MKVTWFGNASILIEAAGERILFDPFVQLRGGGNPNSLDDFIHETSLCITHGHLDHLMTAAEFLDKGTEGEATVYCGSVAAHTLEEQGFEGSNMVLVKPGMKWKIGDVRMEAFTAGHVQFGWKRKWGLLRGGRIFRYFWNALFLASAGKFFSEGNETFLYELTAEGKRVQIMGSLALDPQVSYESGADLLVLPLEGKGLEEQALAIVERLLPKQILLDHFDDAFPPVSSAADPGKLLRMLEERYPEILVTIPEAGKTMVL